MKDSTKDIIHHTLDLMKLYASEMELPEGLHYWYNVSANCLGHLLTLVDDEEDAREFIRDFVKKVMETKTHMENFSDE